MLYQTVLFDFDGTIADSGPGILLSLRELIRRNKYKELSDEALSAMIGPPINIAFPSAFGITGEEELAEAIAVYQQIFAEIALPMLQTFTGIPALLQELHEAGATVCIATCKTQHVCEAQADMLGIRPYIDHICGAQPARNLYDKAEIIEEVLRMSGAPKANAIMVGDRKHDLLGAGAAGIPAIGVAYGSGTMEELLAHKHLHIANSVAELRALLLP